LEYYLLIIANTNLSK